VGFKKQRDFVATLKTEERMKDTQQMLQTEREKLKSWYGYLASKKYKGRLDHIRKETSTLLYLNPWAWFLHPNLQIKLRMIISTLTGKSEMHWVYDVYEQFARTFLKYKN